MHAHTLVLIHVITIIFHVKHVITGKLIIVKVCKCFDEKLTSIILCVVLKLVVLISIMLFDDQRVRSYVLLQKSPVYMLMCCFLSIFIPM